MNLINLFGYVMCLAGFGLLVWFSFQVPKLITTFSTSAMLIFIIGALLILAGYLMTQVRSSDYE